MTVNRKHFVKANHGIEVHNLPVDHYEVHPDTVLEGFEKVDPVEAIQQMSQRLGQIKMYRNAAVPVDVVRAVSKYGRWFDSFESETMHVEIWKGRSSCAVIR